MVFLVLFWLYLDNFFYNIRYDRLFKNNIKVWEYYGSISILKYLMII